MDETGAIGTEGGTGGSVATSATGGNGITIATGGSSATNAIGGSSAAIPTGGSSAAIATGGKAATGGKGATGGVSASAGSGATIAIGGKSATGGKSAMGGISASAGSGATIATGGKVATGGLSALGGTGASIATGGSSTSGGTSGSAGASGTTITSCNDSFPFLGTWEGNILDFYFEPKQALKLVLTADSLGVITGTLTWGEGAPPPAPEGADIPYPPGYWEQQTGMMPGMQAPDPWPGFAYTIVRGAGCDTSFRFGVSTSELWQDWCALQTPVYTPDYGWACTLQGGGGSDGTTCTVEPPNMAWQTYPLWKCEACGGPFSMNGGVCACDQNGCFANTTATQTFNLAYSVSGSSEILSGPDPSCGDCTVRLARKN